MDMQSSQYVSEYLTSCQNDKTIGSKIISWQQKNAANLADNTIFSPESRKEYDKLVKELAQCFIAFVGCKQIRSRLPNNKEELSQILADNSKLGKWCLWHIDAHYIELIVERLISLRSVEPVADTFNPYALISFKIPMQIMGPNVKQRPWICQENIAQIRNQEAEADQMVLTALAEQQRNEDTAAEFSKILEQELQEFKADTVLEFAHWYGISIRSEDSDELSKADQKCLNTVLQLLRQEHSIGLFRLASYVSMVLINYACSKDKEPGAGDFRKALGQSLQAAGFPRNSDIFITKSFSNGGTATYRKALNALFNSQAGFENRRDDKDNVLDWNRLGQRYQELSNPNSKNYISSETERQVIQQFIAAAQSSQDEFDHSYHELCFIDWSDHLEHLFEKKNTPKKAKLSERSCKLFEKLDEQLHEAEYERVQQEAIAQGKDPKEALNQWKQEHSSLDEYDRETLALADMRSNQRNEKDKERLEDFFNEHRSELYSHSPKLYSEWERLICQDKFECTDFCSGLSQVLISLNSEQSDVLKIELSCSDFKTPEEFLLNHNYDLLTFFSVMYSPLLRKLQASFPEQFVFDLGRYNEIPNPFTDFDEFFQYCLTKSSEELTCTKDTDKHLQLTFTVTLYTSTSDHAIDKNSCLLIWRMKKDSVGLKLAHDLEQVIEAKGPVVSFFVRNLLNESGGIQHVNLDDLSSFLTDAAMQQGAFICEELDEEESISRQSTASVQNILQILHDPGERLLLKRFEAKCLNTDEIAEPDDFFTSSTHNNTDFSLVQRQFGKLCQQYVQAIECMRQGRLTFDQIKKLSQLYALMQLDIIQLDAATDVRRSLLGLVQSIGLALEQTDSNFSPTEFVVATPYHIPSMYNHMLSLERMFNLISTMFKQRVFVTRHKVMLDALARTQNIPDGPQVIAAESTQNNRYSVFRAVQGLYGYTLYQSVSGLQDVATSTDNSTKSTFALTSFDNEEQVKTVVEYLQNYVTVHPQVREQFNVMIFNCSDVEVIFKLYSSLIADEFLIKVNICLSVVHDDKAVLSRIYRYFERMNSLNAEEQKTPDNTGNIQLKFMHKGAIIPQNSGYLFDVGLMLHACDSKATFVFSDQKLSVVQNESAQLHNQVNFATYQKKFDSSYLFLVSGEQSLTGIASLYVLQFMTNKQGMQSDSNNEEATMKLVDSLSCCLQTEKAPKEFTTPLPSFQLKVIKGNNGISENLDFVHNVAEEVLTLDDLLTKAQFDNMKIRLVKYQQVAQGNTSIFISTKIFDRVKTLLSALLNELKVESSDTNILSIYKQAVELSGGLLIHSQIADIYTKEMLGLVLSKYVAEQYLTHINNGQSQSQNAFFMLDEYASWFGSKTGDRSDILLLNISERTKSRYLLRILLIESKFVQDGVSLAATKSVKQSKATAETFFDLFSHDNAMCTVDRQLRLQQLNSMLYRSPALAQMDSFKFQQDLLQGKIDIALSVFSCIYGYKDQTSRDEVQLQCFDFGNVDTNTLQHNPKGLQLIFNAKQTEELLQNMLSQQPAAQSPVLAQHVFSQPLFNAFNKHQEVVALDADPSDKYKRGNLSAVPKSAVLKDNESLTENAVTSTAPVMPVPVSSEPAESLDNAVNLDAKDTAVSEASYSLTTSDNPVSFVSHEKQVAVSAGGNQSDAASYETTDVIEQGQDAGGPEQAAPGAIVEEQVVDKTVSVTKAVETEASSVSRNDETESYPVKKRSLSSLFSGISKPKTETVPEPELNIATDDSELSDQEKQLLNRFFKLHPNFARLVQNTPDQIKQELEKHSRWADEMQHRMIQAFQGIGMRPEIIARRLNTNGAVFSFKGNSDFEKQKIERKQEFILTTYAVKMDKISAQLGSIDIFVPFDDKKRIMLPYLPLCRRRSLNIEGADDTDTSLSGFNSRILLGLQESGAPAYLDFEHDAPHTLIGGITKSGKSTLINVILLDLALTCSPDELALILVDPKSGTEMKRFRALPHVFDDALVTDKESAKEILARLVSLMEERYQQISRKGDELNRYIADIASYNRFVDKSEHMPRIVLVFDEFADWFRDDKSFKAETLDKIEKLGAKARACGIHLILATQRPDKDVVDPKLRNNLGNCIALKTKDLNNSAIILGNKDHDASRLLGNGHMICQFTNVFYAQSAFIDSDHLTLAIDAICQDWAHIDKNQAQ